MAEALHLTPMFRQYHAHKQQHPDAILLFRMGDFYEMFFEDAERASPVLELALTARGRGTDLVVPMCGFPHHQLETYTARLVNANHRVAICEQVEDPRQAKGLVRREVVRIVTPGTVQDPSQLPPKANVWLAAVAQVGPRLAAAFLDATTGEFLAWETDPDEPRPWEALGERLRHFGPREIVHAEGLDWPASVLQAAAEGAVLTPTDPQAFHSTLAATRLAQQLGVASLDGFGMRDRQAATCAAGGLLQYLEATQRCELRHVDRLLYHEPSRYLRLDPATRRNLELERSLRDGSRQGTLFDVLDGTLTAGGGRLLRRWLLAPLLDGAEIARRHDGVELLVRSSQARRELRDGLQGMLDVERLLARAIAGLANARELLALRDSLARVPVLREALAPLSAPLLAAAAGEMDPCPELVELLGAGLAEEPPISLREGGLIRDGFNPELDELRAARRDGRAYIASLELRERQATGIASLKVRFNKVFGYYIEVSKPNLPLVPAHYQRKQTIANGERFITPELKEHELKVLHAQDRIATLEHELFLELRAAVTAAAPRLKAVARAAAVVDVVAALAEIAAARGYCRPLIDDGRLLHIAGGRHPVVELKLDAQAFVPNDTQLEAGGRAIAVLTGPNMGGKSTYLRQVALIVLLAQAGSFVPAQSAQVGIVDRIFCRVGASDNLAEGHSTFMVEMTETANILHHASSRSLLLLDEVGRGTSTFDGVSIAWAVLEFLHAFSGGAPRTLFATHYHELTELAVELASVLNLRMAVREWGESLAFLHRVEQGAADRSYGLQVARLAGVPRPVVARAREILANLERDEYGGDGLPRRARRSAGPARHPQSTLFGWAAPDVAGEQTPHGPGAEVLAELRAQDPDRLTPLDALQLVAAWRRKLVAPD
jgi:DNA mismatch repair protein MutS